MTPTTPSPISDQAAGEHIAIELPERVIDQLFQAAGVCTYHPDGDQREKLYVFAANVVAETLARIPSIVPTTGSAPDGWISAADRLPDVKKGTEREFIVACRRARNGKTYVFAASYLNQMGLMSDDDDCPEDGRPTTGWFNERNDIEYDNAFQIVCDEGDEVTHWMPLPDAPALLAASMGGDKS